MQAIKKDLRATGTSSAAEAVALNGEDGIAMSDSNDEEDADETMSYNKYNVFGVDCSP